MARAHAQEPPPRRGYHHGNLREALVEAARRLIAEVGPDGFTLKEATRIAGVSPSASYRHFPDREALVEDVAARGFRAFTERLAAAGQGEPGEAFLAMGRAYLAFAREEPGYYRAMFSRRKSGADPGVGGGDGAFARLVQAVEQAVPAGTILASDPRRVALQVWALSHGLASLDIAGQMPLGADVPAPEDVLLSGAQALLQGQSRPPQDPTP